MNKSSIRVILGAVFAALPAADALAVPAMSVYVMPIYQTGDGPQVNIGHVVSASTDYNKLVAGGTYRVSCASPEMLDSVGQRTLSAGNILGGLYLHVTIPTQLPATINMPGYYSLPRGSNVGCTYEWTAQATESGYDVSVGGIKYQSGNGTVSEGSTQTFYMKVREGNDPNDNSSCIP